MFEDLLFVFFKKYFKFPKKKSSIEISFEMYQVGGSYCSKRIEIFGIT